MTGAPRTAASESRPKSKGPPPSLRSEEIELFAEGLSEVQRAADFAYKEVVDMRARMQIVTALSQKIMDQADLPDELRADLTSVLEVALPPRDALDNGSEGSDSERMQRFMESGHGFAARAQDLWNMLDSIGSRGRSPTGDSQSASGPEEEPEPMALDQYEAQGLMGRARMVCRELVTGW